MTLDDILHLPNLRRFSDFELRMINQLFRDFPYMTYKYGSTAYPPTHTAVLPLLRAGVLGLSFVDQEAAGSVLVVKLSAGSGFFGRDRIGFHVFHSEVYSPEEFSSLGTYKTLAGLLVSIANDY